MFGASVLSGRESRRLSAARLQERPSSTWYEDAAKKRREFNVNVLLLFPKFPVESCWNTDRTTRLFYRRAAEMAPLGLLTVAAYLPYWFATQASLNLAEDDELMALMTAANLSTVFIGIETPDADLLRGTGKSQNAAGNPLDRIRRIRERGIHVTGGFIVGFDNEPESVFELQYDFISQSGIGVAMMGMLVAIPHTQLWRRLQREGRLLAAVTPGNQTLEGINFVPRGSITREQYLRRFARRLERLYEPTGFFERILPALLALRKSQPPIRAVIKMFFRLSAGFLRQCFYLGVVDRAARCGYWRCFFTLLWKNPRGLEGFAVDCKFYHHLHHHAEFVKRSIDDYLENPHERDVLERTVQPDNPLESDPVCTT
jgi:hypothetical protein